MKRFGARLARVLALALLLLTLGGGLANADGGSRPTGGYQTPASFPDDPGFTP